MSADTRTAGYPVHAVQKFARWTNRYEARFTDWAAACGAGGTLSGHSPFGQAGSARRAELCPICFPGRDHTAAHPQPVEMADRDELRQVTA